LPYTVQVGRDCGGNVKEAKKEMSWGQNQVVSTSAYSHPTGAGGGRRAWKLSQDKEVKIEKRSEERQKAVHQ